MFKLKRLTQVRTQLTALSTTVSGLSSAIAAIPTTDSTADLSGITAALADVSSADEFMKGVSLIVTYLNRFHFWVLPKKEKPIKPRTFSSEGPFKDNVQLYSFPLAGSKIVPPVHSSPSLVKPFSITKPSIGVLSSEPWQFTHNLPLSSGSKRVSILP